MNDTSRIRVTPGDAESRWDDLLDAARRGERVTIEENGEVIAALVPEREYDALVRASGLMKADGGRSAYLSALDEIHARNGDLDPEVVERDVAAAIEAVRAEARAQDRALFARFGHLADEELVNVVTNAVRAMRVEAQERSSPATHG